VWQRILHDRLALVAAAILAALIADALLVSCGALAAGWNARAGPSFQSPCWQFPLGTDLLGRSVAQKIVYGAKISVAVGVFGSALAVLIGGALGMMAGYLSGRFDDFVIWLCSTFSAVPGVLLMCVVAFVLQDAQLAGCSLKGVPAVCLALGLTHWVGTCRLVRSDVLRQREREYVVAAVALGASPCGIVYRHLLPNCTHLLLYDGFMHCVGFVRAEVMLSFLGLGATDQSSWGVMLDDARFEISRNVWWPMAAVVVVVFLFSFAAHYVGDVLRNAADAGVRTA
jgi:peptide/nickel transport system permease protein